jgi:hypothetical protein
MKILGILASVLSFNLGMVMPVEDVIVYLWQNWSGLIKMLCVCYRRILMDNHYHVRQGFLFTQMMMYKMVTFLMKNQNLIYKIKKFS